MEIGSTWLRQARKLAPVAVGHRVAHGGSAFDRPALIDDAVLAQLAQYTALAPLHQPNNLAPIRAIRSLLPNVLQVACFDTAFHRGHTAIADHYAIPERYYAEGVRRYGFHGLSYEFIAGRLPEIAPRIAGGRIIVAHLGSGASMCALSAGRSVETSMGFTALDGLPMGTRPGQIDPGVVLYLLGHKRMSVAEVEGLLYRESGLKALSGISNDVRELDESADPRAGFALDYFAYRVSLEAGRLAAALGGIDGFVFTGGIGENSPTMRTRIAKHLAWLGAALDPQANAHGAPTISRPDSWVALHVIPTDEELMIARHTLALLAGAGASRLEAAGAA
jgi:acetate kinase